MWVVCVVELVCVFDCLVWFVWIGGDVGGGVMWIVFLNEECEVIEFVCDWLCEFGLYLVFDGFGNLFVFSDVNVFGVVLSLCGLYLDMVLLGGCFDGVFGVVVVIEVVVVMCVVDWMFEWLFEVVVWCCEELVCFVYGKVGSLLFSG